MEENLNFVRNRDKNSKCTQNQKKNPKKLTNETSIFTNVMIEYTTRIEYYLHSFS